MKRRRSGTRIIYVPARIGNDLSIEVHIRVDGQITVSRAHELTKEIESKLRLKFGPATHIVLHVEPIKEKKDE